MLGDSIRRRRSAPGRGVSRSEAADEGTETGTGDGRRPPVRQVPAWLLWLGIGAGVLVVSFVVGYVLASQLLFPRPETAGTGVPVPALYGMDVESAQRSLAEVGLRLGVVTELASMRTDSGRVMAQEPLPDQQLRPGADVALAISTGPPTVRVPPVTGLGAASARDLLEAAGFEVELREVRSGQVARGRVLRTEPEVGTEVRLPASLTVLVDVGPEEEAPVDAPAADTVAPAWP
jgi:eukaryotic-like serine/threonine-protein kinase